EDGDLLSNVYGTFNVYTVGRYAFQNEDINTVTIEKGVSEISEGAFKGSSVQKILIPETVEKIIQKAFSGCTKLTTLGIEDGNVPLTIGFEAFKDCSSLQDITLKRVKNIDRYAFENVNINNLTFAENVYISDDAFSKCNIDNVVFVKQADTIASAFSYCTIGKLVLPEKANYVSTAVFYDTEINEMVIPVGMSDVSAYLPATQGGMGFSLNKISVKGNNLYYTVVDDVLFNKEMTELIYYSPSKTDKTYKIPAGVSEISAKAFTGCDNLEKIIISDGVRRICKNTFFKCSNLKQVELSDKLEYIESSAFNSCPIEKLSVLPKSLKEVSAGAFNGHSLTDVYYDGTEEEWNNISYYEEFDLGDSVFIYTSFYPNVTMHFNTVTPEDPDVPDEPDHTHSFTSGVVIDATCTDDGIMSFLCKCGNNYTEIIPAKGHKDSDGDYKCDNDGCDYEFEKPAPSDPSENCTCNCHKTGFMGFIWKILRIFYKLFKTNSVCACGAAHY
ncbi:MAG: leucine-rich repeat domain-containing protein, partial [Clostridia bacterium]|nr:leucine-rich repeat domain-containing protein [Clostridia bacterium]